MGPNPNSCGEGNGRHAPPNAHRLYTLVLSASEWLRPSGQRFPVRIVNSPTITCPAEGGRKTSKRAVTRALRAHSKAPYSPGLV
jgi:hypothetical protein